MKAPSEETKIKQHRGEGHGADYKPWIKTREFNSIGTCVNLVDWKHGRTIELLSQAESMVYCHLRWDDDVVDIREQFPLNLDETTEIANTLGYRLPNNGKTHMTSDLLVDYKDGHQEVYSVKSKYQLSNRAQQKLAIEKQYWNHHNVPFYLVFKDDYSEDEYLNILDAITFYDEKWVDPAEPVTLAWHLIARKEIKINMILLDSDRETLMQLLKEYKENNHGTN